MNVNWYNDWLYMPQYIDEMEPLCRQLSIRGFFILRYDRGTCFYIGRADNVYEALLEVLRGNTQIRDCQQLGHLQILVGRYNEEDENVPNDALTYLRYIYNPSFRDNIAGGFESVNLPAENMIARHAAAMPYFDNMGELEQLRFRLSYESWRLLNDYLPLEEVNNRNEQEINRILEDLNR